MVFREQVEVIVVAMIECKTAEEFQRVREWCYDVRKDNYGRVSYKKFKEFFGCRFKINLLSQGYRVEFRRYSDGYDANQIIEKIRVAIKFIEAYRDKRMLNDDYSVLNKEPLNYDEAMKHILEAGRKAQARGEFDEEDYDDL